MLEHDHDKLISFLQNTSVWTVTSGTLGGVYKTINLHQILLSSVNVDGGFAVASYV